MHLYFCQVAFPMFSCYRWNVFSLSSNFSEPQSQIAGQQDWEVEVVKAYPVVLTYFTSILNLTTILEKPHSMDFTKCTPPWCPSRTLHWVGDRSWALTLLNKAFRRMYSWGAKLWKLYWVGTMQSNTSGFTVYREDCKAFMMSCLLLDEILDCLSHETLIVLLHCMWLWKLTNSITGICFDYQCYDGPVCLGFGCCQISKHT